MRSEDQPRHRVLVVDDDPMQCRVLHRILRDEFDVTTETAPTAALRRIENGERFALILSDIMMPELDGAQLHARILAIDAGQAQRVAFLSASSLPDDIDAYVARATLPRLHKPVALVTLLMFVRDRVRR